MCRTCNTFTQLRDALRAYDRSSEHLQAAGHEAAAARDEELAVAIHDELHVYDGSGDHDQEILWAEC